MVWNSLKTLSASSFPKRQVAKPSIRPFLRFALLSHQIWQSSGTEREGGKRGRNKKRQLEVARKKGEGKKGKGLEEENNNFSALWVLSNCWTGSCPNLLADISNLSIKFGRITPNKYPQQINLHISTASAFMSETCKKTVSLFRKR